MLHKQSDMTGKGMYGAQVFYSGCACTKPLCCLLELVICC